jgi:hypothetical protein
MTHPETYELTRDEWSNLNRALCGARLEMYGAGYPVGSNRKAIQNRRLLRTNDALDIISTVYKRAEEKISNLSTIS